MLKIALSSLYFLLITPAVTAQHIPLETWRTHFSYKHVRLVEAAGDKIFCAAQNGLFYYNLQDQSVNKISKINGLSDVSITAMNYNDVNDLLVVGYSSGGIDLITQEGILEIQDFKNSDLVTDKAIRDIQFWNDDVLVATALGVIVISISNGEITENFRSIGQNASDVSVSCLFIDGDDLWAITNQGIQVGSLHDNLLDFNNWTLFPDTQNQRNSFFGMADHQLFSIKNDSILIKFEIDSWVESGIVIPGYVNALQTSSDLFISTNNTIYNFDGSQLGIEVNSTEQLSDFLYTNEFWLGTESNGLIRHGSQESIYPDGPLNDSPTNIVAANGNIYLFYGPAPESYQGQIDQLGYDLFNGESWIYEIISDFYNLSDIVFLNNHGFISSVGFGLYSMQDQMILNHQNSLLSDSKSSLGPIISDLEAQSTLWIASYNNVNPMATLDVNGDLVTFQESDIGTDKPEKITFTSEGAVLMQNAAEEGGGFIIFNPPGQSRRLSITEELPSNNINSLKVDKEDIAWVGTSQGLISYPDASFLFDFVQPVNVAFENNLLFENDQIFAIAVDGGNRIWISTKEGLWVYNASFTVLDHYFSEENSPLPSNQITQLEYNSENGEMYIQTDKGLVSFRSGSSEEADDYDEVTIFPNPVRPGYTGLVGISGLRYGTFVKITNINGKLIREIGTNGGTASWDLLDHNNQKVNSGVYIVLTSTGDGKDKYVGKIAVVN